MQYATRSLSLSMQAPARRAALRAAAAGMVLMGAVCAAAAQDAPTLASGAYQDGSVLAMRASSVSVATSTQEITAVRGRLDAPGAALAGVDPRTGSDLAGVTYRVWMNQGRADVGVGVGTVGYLRASPDGHVEGPRTLVGSVPTVTAGVRYHMTSEHTVFADASGARGLGAEPNTNYYNTKVGVEWKPAKSYLGFDQGSVGVHLDSGYKVSLKPRHGGLGLYLRGQF